MAFLSFKNEVTNVERLLSDNEALPTPWTKPFLRSTLGRSPDDLGRNVEKKAVLT